MKSDDLYKYHFKRILDIVLSFLFIITFFPVILITALLVFIFMGRPIFFTQDRPGFKERIFKIYKFRTMTNRTDYENNEQSDDLRITKLGGFLRRSSLDELPELFNVLKGEMSIVGPRPLIIRYLPYYNETERKRHDVRPGITGLAQINGRNFLSWDERLALDVLYVDNISFALDIKIILKSILPVIKQKDIKLNPIQDLDTLRSGKMVNN